jgi:hypothetical protein
MRLSTILTYTGKHPDITGIVLTYRKVEESNDNRSSDRTSHSNTDRTPLTPRDTCSTNTAHDCNTIDLTSAILIEPSGFIMGCSTIHAPSQPVCSTMLHIFDLDRYSSAVCYRHEAHRPCEPIKDIAQNHANQTLSLPSSQPGSMHHSNHLY